MTYPSAHPLTQVIQVDRERCVNCHACIAVCPVKVCNDGSGSYVNVRADTCIGCGRCLAACTHHARHFIDDRDAFLHGLDRREKMIAVVAPSAVANFADRHLRLNGWLKSVGVEAVFDVAFGAELCAWSYVDYLRRCSPRLVIAQPCAAVVTYVQVYHPELLEYLAPLDSPMLHTMKMVRRFFPQYGGHKIAVISPCPAKKREFQETGLGDYNVTYRSLADYHQSAGIDLESYAQERFATPPPDRGVFLPMPGGLVSAMERWLPDIRSRTRTVQGPGSVFPYLATLPETLRRSPDAAPLLIDCLSCKHGCNCGPATLASELQIDAAEHRTRQRHRELHEQDAFPARRGEPEFERLLREYWEEGLYAREYLDLSANNTTQRPSEEERKSILRAMHKHSEKDLYNCCSCGYGACDDMTVAIHNGLNRPENCHHYLAKEREISQRQLAEYRDHLENLVADRTAELKRANDRLSSEVRERQRVEEAIQDNEQKLNAIIYGSPIPQFIIDKDHKVIYWNHALERLSGIRRDQMVGTSDHWKAFYGESRPCLADLLVDNDQTAVGRHYQGRCRRSTLLEDAYEGIGFFPAIGPDGKWLYYTATVIKDSKGAAVGAVETLEDITESRRTEIQLARSRQAAEAANRAKSEFLANMSHEIRTPMTAIMGYTDLIANGCPGACGFGREMLFNHIDVICRNADLLLQIINDILDLSKIEAGRLEVERVACSPWQIVCDVVGLLKVQAAGKGLGLRVERPGPIPKTIQSDPTRLRQILFNLVGNAIKFTEAGEVRLVVGAPSDPAKGTKLRIDVIDTGVGMAEEQLAKLFRPFSQADTSTTRRFGGTGLGLTISKRLAELLGGDLHVTSAVGQGSTFTLTIDVASPEGVEPSESLAQPDLHAAEASSADPAKTPAIPGRVLLAEDGRDNQRLIELVLRKAGAEVALAENGQVALDLALASRAQGTAFDVILMDMQMPVMDGYEATSRLRAAGWSGPIVALTANAMAGDRDKCLAAGCNDYVSKPLDRGKLLSLLAQYTQRPVILSAAKNLGSLEGGGDPLSGSR